MAYIRAEKRRGFQPPWYTVFIYQCDACKKPVVLKANAFRGNTPVRGVGAIRCDCGETISL